MLGTLKTSSCGIGGGKVQNILWRTQSLLVTTNLKHVAILCRTTNLFQDRPEDIADDMIDIAQTFQSNYNSINIAIRGILPHDGSWSINRVLIKEVNKTLKAICSQSFFLHVTYNSCWTVAYG